jgi:hypothetical protein
MNLKKLDEAVAIMKDGLKGSLLSASFWSTADGQLFAGYNGSEVAAALGNKLTTDINAALKDGIKTSLGKYYMLDLLNGQKIVVVPMNDYQMGIYVDKNCQTGMLLNIVIPKVIDKFEEALIED